MEQQEQEASWVVTHREAIVPVVLRAVLGRRHAVSGAEVWKVDLADQVRHLLAGLAASLFVDDDAVLAECRDWVGERLVERGAPDEVLPALWHALGVPLRGQVLAGVLLTRTAPGYAGAHASA